MKYPGFSSLRDREADPRHQAIRRFVGSFACHARVLVLARADVVLADHLATRCGAKNVVLVPLRNRRLAARLLRFIAASAATIASSLDDDERFDLVVLAGGGQSGAEKAMQHLTDEGTLILLGCDLRANMERVASVQSFALAERPPDAFEIRPTEEGSGGEEILVVQARPDTKLHVGSGPETLPGWTNIDNKPYPGVDRLLDLRFGLPFRNIDFIFMEHFIEHLDLRDGLALLTECRRALGPDGVLRISTPNLDWVWATSYHPQEWSSEAEMIRDCLSINRAFRGWGHKFLYNGTMLRETLQQAGFSSIEPVQYGESRHPTLRDLERHEKYPDTPELPHILIVEASGHGAHEVSQYTRERIAEFERDVRVD